jgi:tripartite-type tricarboxylate transporter receptor subunit TctC
VCEVVPGLPALNPGYESGMMARRVNATSHLRTMILAVGVLAIGILTVNASAQTYPTRPITIIVPFVAGGPTDVLARVLGEHIRADLGQPVLVENVSGAGGSIGVGRVAAAAPDGYTISIGHFGTHVANGAIYPLKYDLQRDLDPLARLPSNPMVVVTRKDFPAANLKDLAALLKTNPGKTTAGTAGAGSGSHIGGVFLASLVDAPLQFVPYRGTAPALQDLVAGQIDLMVDQAANSLPQVRQGSVKALAVTAATRLAAAPGIPTAEEAGLPGLQMELWNGTWVPHGTPGPIVETLNRAVVKALADPAVRDRLAPLGLEGPPEDQRTPEALRGFQSSEIEKWWPIIKAAHITAE